MILDGHNAAFRFGFGGRTERERREALIAFFREKRPQGNDELWVVFDSRRHEGHPHSRWLDGESQSVRICFAPGSFDDWVVEQAESGAVADDTVVVTDDIFLRLRLGGRVVCTGLDEFFGRKRGRR